MSTAGLTTAAGLCLLLFGCADTAPLAGGSWSLEVVDVTVEECNLPEAEATMPVVGETTEVTLVAFQDRERFTATGEGRGRMAFEWTDNHTGFAGKYADKEEAGEGCYLVIREGIDGVILSRLTASSTSVGLIGAAGTCSGSPELASSCAYDVAMRWEWIGGYMSY